MLYEPSTYTLGSFLCAPEGYRLEHIVAATYSLGAQALLTLAAYGYLAHSAPQDTLEDVRLSGVAWKSREIRAWAGKHLSVRSDAAVIPDTTEGAIWENSGAVADACCKTVKPKEGSFHPKLLLACFQSQKSKEEWRYRLQLGSRNLSSGSALELGLCMEGVPASQEDTNPNGSELHDFLIKSCELENAAHLAALSKTRFQKPENETDYCLDALHFHNNDHGNSTLLDTLKKQLTDCPPADQQPLSVYSPFLHPDGDGVLYLSKKLKELKDVPIEYCSNPDAVLRCWKSNENDRLFVRNDDGFLHAKLYAWHFGEKTDAASGRTTLLWHMLVGSANASENGLTKNVELMASFRLSFSLEADNAILQNSFPELCPNKEQRRLDCHGETQPKTGFSALDTEMLPALDDGKRLESCVRLSLQRMLKDISASIDANGNAFTLKLQDEAVTRRILCQVPYEGGVLIFSDLRLELERQRYGAWSGNGHALSELPCCHYLRAVLSAEWQGTRISVSGSIPWEWGNNTQNPPQTLREPASLLRLLSCFRARDAIPRCRCKGFADAGDGVMERLEAFCASWSGIRSQEESLRVAAESVHAQYRKFQAVKDAQSIAQLYEQLAKRRDDPAYAELAELWRLIYETGDTGAFLSDEDERDFALLHALLWKEDG